MFIYSIFYEYKLTNLYNDIDYAEFIVRIESNKMETNQKNKYICRVISINEISKYKNTKLILYTNKDNELKYGDIVQLNGYFEYAKQDRNYKGFNYRRTLWQNNIYGILKSESVKKIDTIKNIDYYLNIIKNKIENNIDSSIKNIEYSNLLKGILLGDKSNIFDDTKESFRDASLSHILAVSGMHLGYIIVITKKILDYINNKKLKNILSILVMFLFVCLIGGTPSSIRAFVMFGLLSVSEIFYRKSTAIVNLFSAFLIIVIINPFYIENIGMWLSFTGTLGILELYQKIKIKHKNKFLNFILQNFILSICVQICIFPIIIYSFNTISFTFFISNILVSFFIAPIIILGIIIGTFNNILFLGNLEYALLKTIFQISNFISKLSFSKVYVNTPLLVYVIIYYGFIYCLLRKRKYLKILLKVIITLLLIFNIFRIITNEFTIYFVDVGQGDCTLIKTRSNKTILIDGGEGKLENFDQGKNTVIPYLLDRGYTKLDYIIISHFDSDHVGSILSIMEELDVGKIVISKQIENSENFEKFIEINKTKNIEVMVIDKGDCLKIDKDVWIEFLWPNIDNVINENALNNNSIVCKVNYKKFSCLFTGDIENKAEKEMILENIDIKSTIIKIAHHGSNTSSIQEFLELVRPKIALIGVGENNKFGHPNDEIIQRLENLNIKIYRTDLNGEVEITVSRNGKIKIKTHIK